MRNRKDYPDNWTDTIRPAVLKRDNYKCNNCNIKHRKSYVFLKDNSYFEIPDNELKEWKSYGDKAYKVYLQIAHLDRNTKNNKMSNLKALCPKCHLAYDRVYNNMLRKCNKKQP